MRRVVVATHNTYKVVEIAALLDFPEWDVVPLSNHFANSILDMPAENASTFEGNARIKARFAHEMTGCATLADDSGLVVDALDGAPGIYSARYAGDGATAVQCNEKLLADLEGVPPMKRTARFVCALLFIDESGAEYTFMGACEGHIAERPRGEHGFGYDPLFIPCDEEGHPGDRTLAEYTAEEKNAISHRADALAKLREAMVQKRSHTKVRIVAFDLDGTLIDAASPVRLVNRLVRNRIMSVRALTKISVWGMRYKMGTELDQSLPRKYIFGSFTNFPAADANSIMINLYNEELHHYLRPEALARIERHKAKDELIILVSASFDPIVRAATRDVGAYGYIATQMEVKNGYYTGRTIGSPPEGEQKLIQLTAYADAQFGVGNWEISWAYGDHFSDEYVLDAAEKATAVDPDRRLSFIARTKGWEIVEWKL